MKFVAYILLALALLYCAYVIARFAYRVHLSKSLVTRAHAYERMTTGPRLLIVGDSTAVGVGASSPETSIAGLFAREYPHLSIENRAVSGATITDILTQMRGAGEQYDLILIQGGPNDVISYRDLDISKRDSVELLTLARAKSDHVVMLSGGNAGLVPLIPWPFSLNISHRTRMVRSHLLTVTQEHGVAYVDLYQERKDDEFSKDPDRFYAADGFHPADAGYAFWYVRIQETIRAHFPNLVL